MAGSQVEGGVSIPRVSSGRVRDGAGVGSTGTNFGGGPSRPPRPPRQGLFGRLRSAVSGVANAVGSRLKAMGPTARVASVAGVALALTAGGAGLAGVMSGMGANGVNEMVLWVDDEEPCVDYIQEAKSELGQGENKIDEVWNGHAVGIHATREFDLCSPRVDYHGLVSPYCFPSGTSQAVVQDAWVAAGAKHDDMGFCKLNDCYLIACTSVFGEVGDKITFFFDDGSHIDCIKIDAKAETVEWYDPTPATKWGHNDGRGVIEFCGENRIGDNPYSTLGKTGRHTTSWTNHGKAVSVGSEMGGSVGGATAASAASGRGVAASAMEDCQARSSFDNSTLVSALISYSYSQRREQADHEMSTALYEEVCIATLGADDACASYHFHSCDRGVAAAVRWTGADVNFPAGACDSQFLYCQESPLWEEVVSGVSISGDDDWAQTVGLQPGDIGISYGNHTLAYVGNEAVLDGYEQFIKGNDGTVPGTGGDIGEPTPGSAWVMASYHQRGAGIQNDIDDRSYSFFRYVGDYPDADKYADVGQRAALTGASSKGTSCECAEVEEETNCGEKIATRALELAHTAVNDGKDYQAIIEGAGYGDLYEYHDGNIFNIGPTVSDNQEAWGAGEPLPTELGDHGINMEFERWQEEVVKPGGYQNADWYACCSPWPAGVLRELGIDDDMTIIAFDQTDYAREHPETYQVIPIDASKTWEEQCKPGDILNNPTCHTAMWVGNRLAQKAFPGTTGNVVEAGQYSRRNIGVTEWSGNGDAGYNIIRVRCPDDNDGDADSLSYIQQSDGKSYPDPHGSTNVHMTCDPTSIVHAAIILTGDYSMTPNSVAEDLVRLYGADRVYSGYDTIGGAKSVNTTLLRTMLQERYGLAFRSITQPRGASALERVKGALLSGHMVVAGACVGYPNGSSDGSFAKPGGDTRVHKSHTIMFYKYEKGVFWAKDSASDGGGMVPYYEGPQGGHDNYAKFWFENCSYLTEYWIGSGGVGPGSVV